ncbi:MAG: hypothetical protein CVU39_25535 [Chloroflexi bacterium HGW-Chloroflexi-10]|nr:MAG: hypothetical protein CVU39_25535 [Chloroflexi bacterium HGW-Chloroflexi-10]
MKSIPIRTRLITSYILVLLLGMGLAAVWVGVLVEKLYLDTLRENLLAQATLTAVSLEGQPLPLPSSQTYLQTSNTIPGVHTRLLSEQGAVVVSFPMTAVDILPPAAENAISLTSEELLERHEIQQAIQGTPATAIRTVPAAETRRVLYAAAPVYASDQSIIGLVYLATPLPRAGLPLSIILKMGGVVLFAMLLVSAIGYWLSRRLALPVEIIAHAADAVSRGDLTRQVPVKAGIKELDSLGRSFNEMTASLRHADQAKTAFIADVTHELRTPLTVIKGTIETLEDGALEDTQNRGFLLSAMQRETDRLIRLTHDLLLLTRADSGVLNLKCQTVDLVDLLHARCDYFKAAAKAHQVALNINLQPTSRPFNVYADPDRLAQIVDNLLDNAIRYSPVGSVIRINLEWDSNEAHCSVIDSGPGIPVKDLPFIFERFYRVEGARDRHSGGAGLGLSIVRSLVEAHNGRIMAESNPGVETRLHFWLPCQADTQLPKN